MTWDVARFVALDLETYLIEAGILAPRIVCGSTSRVKGGVYVAELHSKYDALFEAKKLLESDRIIVGANIAYDFGCLANAAPSLLPLIFKAYEEKRVYDIQIAQALDAIASGTLFVDPRTGRPMRGRYSLKTCVELVLGRDDAKKNDFYRTRYALLENVPLDEWPEEARQYPLDDVNNTLETAIAQVNGGGAGVVSGPLRNLGDLSDQCETAFCLHLGAIWGFRTDATRVAKLRERVEEAHGKFVERFANPRYAFIRKDGTEDQAAVKRAVIKAYGPAEPCPAKCDHGKILSEKTGKKINCAECSGTGFDVSWVPRTDKGGVSKDRDTLIESGDETLMAYGENEAEKVRDTYLPFLETGLVRPVQLRPNVLVESGRASYDGLIQLLPRGVTKGDIAGSVRPCIVARDGYYFCSVDYAALELCTLAQVCYWVLGYSNMKEVINATGNPGALHTAFAAKLANVSPEEMQALIDSGDANAKKYRQAAKAGNFGFPGGMGEAKFVLAKRKRSEGITEGPDGTIYPGIRFCILLGGQERCGIEKITEWKNRPTRPICKHCVEAAAELRRMWFDQWTEIRPYFAWVSERVDAGGELPCFATERVRGGLDFTNGANNGFQALASDGAKYALRRLVRECYLDRKSPLWGTRPIFFVHDEIFAEMPVATAHLAGPRMAEVMVSAMREYVPDVAVAAEPALMKHWYKEAAPVWIDDALMPGGKRLVPWYPKENTK